MKLASLLALWWAAALLLGLPALAFEQPGMTDKTGLVEVNVVLRVSRKLVHEVTTNKIQRTTPIHVCVRDGPLDAVAFTEATSSVVFDSPPDVPAFTILVRGTTTFRWVLSRPPIEVCGSGSLEFTMRKRVTFEGEEFRSQPSAIDARLGTSVDGIATPPGLIGCIVERMATREIRRHHPTFAQTAFKYGKAELIAAFDEEVEWRLAKLNQASPLEQTVHTLLPETKDWIAYPIVTPTHLLIGAGRPKRRLPELPITDQTDAPLELWIRNQPETQALIAVLKLWRGANKQLGELLPGELGKKLKLGEGFKTLTVKDWLVIQLGRGVLKDAPQPPKTESVWRPLGAEQLEAAAATAVVARPQRTCGGSIELP
jgi:hypothetical protein